jgi:hypothetical protein
MAGPRIPGPSSLLDLMDLAAKGVRHARSSREQQDFKGHNQQIAGMRRDDYANNGGSGGK